MSLRVNGVNIPFKKPMIYLSSYKSAYGPYWAYIDGVTDSHVVISFYGFGPEYNVYVHKADLPYVSYKFVAPEIDNPIYEELLMGLDELFGSTNEEDMAQYNTLLYEQLESSNQKQKQQYLSKVGINPGIVKQLLSYKEYNVPANPSIGIVKKVIEAAPKPKPKMSEDERMFVADLEFAQQFIEKYAKDYIPPVSGGFIKISPRMDFTIVKILDWTRKYGIVSGLQEAERAIKAKLLPKSAEKPLKEYLFKTYGNK